MTKGQRYVRYEVIGHTFLEGLLHLKTEIEKCDFRDCYWVSFSPPCGHKFDVAQ